METLFRHQRARGAAQEAEQDLSLLPRLVPITRPGRLSLPRLIFFLHSPLIGQNQPQWIAPSVRWQEGIEQACPPVDE